MTSSNPPPHLPEVPPADTIPVGARMSAREVGEHGSSHSSETPQTSCCPGPNPIQPHCPRSPVSARILQTHHTALLFLADYLLFT